MIHTLEEIQVASVKKSFEIPGEEFFKGISRKQRWAPYCINPWWYLDSFSALPEEVKLRYNQLHALSVNELFWHLELDFIVKILEKKLADPKLDSDLKRSLVTFCEEERKHSALFKKLNRYADPTLYKNSDSVMRTSALKKTRFANWLLVEQSGWNLAWLWISVFFEERTLVYGSDYVKDHGPELSSQFRDAHVMHMMEEARHVRMDEVLVNVFYNGASKWQRKFAASIFKKFIWDLSLPVRSSGAIAEHLKTEFLDPSVHQAIDQCMRDLPKLRQNKAYMNKLFSPDSAKRTHALLRRYSEFDGVLEAV